MTEYQRWPSAVRSRATMRAQRGSLATSALRGFWCFSWILVMFVLVAWVIEATIEATAACRTPGLAFILPIVKSAAHPIPVTSSGLGFEGKNRSAHALSITMVAPDSKQTRLRGI